MCCRRTADIPTSEGAFEGKPPPSPPAEPAAKNSEVSSEVSKGLGVFVECRLGGERVYLSATNTDTPSLTECSWKAQRKDSHNGDPMSDEQA
jgi:hypothetical protein